jgi:hypothetical protein
MINEIGNMLLIVGVGLPILQCFYGAISSTEFTVSSNITDKIVIPIIALDYFCAGLYLIIA